MAEWLLRVPHKDEDVGSIPTTATMENRKGNLDTNSLVILSFPDSMSEGEVEECCQDMYERCDEFVEFYYGESPISCLSKSGSLYRGYMCVSKNVLLYEVRQRKVGEDIFFRHTGLKLYEY